MTTAMPLRFGDVIVVPFPFSDQTATKKRPAVVVSSEAYHRERPDVILMAITSQFRPTPTVGEVAIPHWQAARAAQALRHQALGHYDRSPSDPASAGQPPSRRPSHASPDTRYRPRVSALDHIAPSNFSDVTSAPAPIPCDHNSAIAYGVNSAVNR